MAEKMKLPTFNEAKKIVGLDKKITYCPICFRGYLLQEEKDHIKKNGCCWACETLGHQTRQIADKSPFAVNGKTCSECGTELEVREDEDWDFDETGSHFVIIHYLFCPKCKERATTSETRAYINEKGKVLPF